MRWTGFRHVWIEGLGQWHGGLRSLPLGSASSTGLPSWTPCAGKRWLPGTLDFIISGSGPAGNGIPAPQGLQPGPAINSDCLWLGLMANPHGPENAGLRLASLSHMIHPQTESGRGGLLPKERLDALTVRAPNAPEPHSALPPISQVADHRAPLSQRGLMGPMGMVACAHLPPEPL